MDCAVFSVVYHGAEPYIHEFLCSLSKQSDKDFTLFLINDGLAGLEGFLEKVDVNVQIMAKSGLPAELRRTGMEWVASEGAKTIIFADADDYFEHNRIEILKKLLKDYDIVCHELLLVGQNIHKPISMLEKFFEDKVDITKDQIATGNCMGLTNTAIRAGVIPSSLAAIPDDIIAFDWALFALCLHAGARAVFTKETKTYYRQHTNNTAPLQNFSEEQILRGVEVKRSHYQFLSKFYEEYASMAESFEDLSLQLQGNETLRQRYCHAVNAGASAASLWWEPIKSLGELGL